MIRSLDTSTSSGRQKKESCFSINFSKISNFIGRNVQRLPDWPKNIGSFLVGHFFVEKSTVVFVMLQIL